MHKHKSKTIFIDDIKKYLTAVADEKFGAGKVTVDIRAGQVARLEMSNFWMTNVTMDYFQNALTKLKKSKHWPQMEVFGWRIVASDDRGAVLYIYVKFGY